MRTSTRCSRVVHRWRTRLTGSVNLFLTLFLFGAFLVPGKTSAQLIKIDGSPSDWNQPGLSHVTDKFDLVNQDDIFDGNAKDFHYAGNTTTPFWKWKLGTAKDKNDIANGAAALVTQVQLDNGAILNGKYIVFAGDRIANDGDAQIGFWFFQDGTAPVEVGGVKYFSPDKHVPPTRGDILVLADFTGGGRNASVTVLEWVGTGGTYPNSNGAFNQLSADAGVAENNSGSVDVPTGWPFAEKHTGLNKYEQNEFYEGYLDLGNLFGQNVLFCPSRYMLETRSTHEITATLDDYVGGPLAGVPQPLVLTGSAVCAGSTGTITSSTSVSGLSYQLYNSSDVAVQAAQNGTGSGLTWNSVPIGNGYYVITTNTGTGCTAKSNLVNVTSIPNPAPTAHNLSSCESGSTGSATFNLNNAIDNADGGTITFHTSLADAQAGTGAIATPTSYSVNVGSPATIYVRSTNGDCYGTTSFTVSVTDNPDVTADNLTGCENGSTGGAAFDLSTAVTEEDGGTLSFYTSEANAIVGTNPIATPGSYNVTVAASPMIIWVRSTSGDCFGVTSFTVTVTDNPDVTAQNLSSCENGSTGGATFNLTSAVNNADGGTLSYYTSEADAIAASNAIATPDAYDVTVAASPKTIWVRSTNGDCFGTTSFTVTVTDNPDPVAHDLTACENDASGSADVNLTAAINNEDGGTITYYTSLTDAQNATNAIGSPSSYNVAVGPAVTIYVRSTNGDCYGTTSFTVAVTANATADAGSADPQCRNASGTNTFGTNTFALSGSGSGGTPTWTVFANPQGYTVNIVSPNSYSTNVEVSGAAVNGGTITMRLTVSGGTCGTATSDVVLTLNALPLVKTLTSTNFCPNVATGGTVVLHDAEAGVSYQLQKDGSDYGAPQTGSAGSDITWYDLPDGNYTVEGTFLATSCNTESGPTSVVENSVPEPMVVDRDVCTGDTLHLAGTPAGGTWSGDHVVQPNIFDAAGLAAGTYTATYTVTNEDGCTASADATITVHALPTVTADDKDVCTGSTVELTGSPAGGTWSGDHVSGTTFDATGLMAGTYTVTYTFENEWGCTNSADATITVHALPTVTADDKDVCTGSTVALTGTPEGGTWSGDHVSGSTFDATGLMAGTYTVTYTSQDQWGCSNSADATITVHALPTVTADDKDVCTGSTVALTGTPEGGTWSGDHVSGSTFDAAGLMAGTYTVTYTFQDQWGCSNSADATITVHALPTVTADDKEVCAGETVELTGTPEGGTWSGDHVSGNMFDASGVTPGTYTVTYTFEDEWGCMNSADATVTVNACGEPYCTYTQGYFGNEGGMACDGTGSTYSTAATITRSVNAQAGVTSGGSITIGGSNASFIIQAGANDPLTISSDVQKVIDVLPGGGPAKELTHLGAVHLASIANSYLKNGRIFNNLLSQTITLAINTGIKSNLGELELQAGTIATAAVQGGCGGTDPVARICNYDPTTGELVSVTNEYWYKTLDAAVVNASVDPMDNTKHTVAGLLALANRALDNTDGVKGSEDGVSLSAIMNAVDAINNVFDGCRSLVGFNIQPCPSVNPEYVAPTTMRRDGSSETMLNNLQVSAYPNPFRDVVKFTIRSKVAGQAQLEVYNSLGQKLNTVYSGFVQANRSVVVEYKAPSAAQQNLIYILAVNGERVTGKLLNVKQ